jgi:hypothetical protein
VKKLLLSRGYDASAIKAIEKAVKKEVDTAVEESKVCRQTGQGNEGETVGVVCVTSVCVCLRRSGGGL